MLHPASTKSIEKRSLTKLNCKPEQIIAMQSTGLGKTLVQRGRNNPPGTKLSKPYQSIYILNPTPQNICQTNS
jgi:hypothetical protein